jgi:hypothetical protein
MAVGPAIDWRSGRHDRACTSKSGRDSLAGRWGARVDVQPNLVGAHALLQALAAGKVRLIGSTLEAGGEQYEQYLSLAASPTAARATGASDQPRQD